MRHFYQLALDGPGLPGGWLAQDKVAIPASTPRQ